MASMYQQKTTRNAIAAMSRLAELYADPGQVASSREIAASRNLPVPLVAKILTDLSRGGLVTGSPGPGGGYRLARSPAEIRLLDVVQLFESEGSTACPYGPDWCGHHEPCPLHHSLLAMQQIFNDYLKHTTFAVFTEAVGNRAASRPIVRGTGRTAASAGRSRNTKAVGRSKISPPHPRTGASR